MLSTAGAAVAATGEAVASWATSSKDIMLCLRCSEVSSFLLQDYRRHLASPSRRWLQDHRELLAVHMPAGVAPGSLSRDRNLNMLGDEARRADREPIITWAALDVADSSVDVTKNSLGRAVHRGGEACQARGRTGRRNQEGNRLMRRARGGTHGPLSVQATASAAMQ
jgi:hypothetical protein